MWAICLLRILEQAQTACDSSQPLGLVKIKNPHSVRHMTLSEACGNSTFCLEQQERDGQVMCRLSDVTTTTTKYSVDCTAWIEWCDFVLRTDKDLHIEQIYRDRTWWEQQLPKLNTFYFNTLLPELTCLQNRKGEIREPSSN